MREIKFKEFCANSCTSKERNKDGKPYSLWHRLQPCLNCPVEEFLDYLEIKTLTL